MALATIGSVQPSLELGQDTFYGLHATQGTRILISINIPLIDVPDYVHKPNPSAPTPGNRRVSVEHAQGFKRYLLSNPEWVAPPLILRADQPVEWQVLSNGQASVKLVKARLNRKLRRLGILDGQHRVLGISLACDEVSTIDMIALRELLEDAKQERDVITEARVAHQLAEAEQWMNRLTSEVIAATIVIEADETKYRQAFFDIADNALGIQQTLKVVFDRRKVLNRAVGQALELPLLKGRVDLEQDRVLGQNQNWLPGKSVVDIMRALQTDRVDGRITAKRELELTEQSVVNDLAEFLEVLTGAFPQLAALQDNKLKPPALRADSLLGSPVFVRVLASAYHELVAKCSWSPKQVQAYFGLLAPHMKTPFTTRSIWFKGARESFQLGTSAPQPRNQLMRAEVALVVRWALEPGARPAGLTTSSSNAAARAIPEPSPSAQSELFVPPSSTEQTHRRSPVRSNTKDSDSSEKAVPDFQSIMLPLLSLLNDDQPHRMSELVDQIGDQFQLSQDVRAEALPSGQPRLGNRVAWERTYMGQAGLVETVARGSVRITERGRALLAECPSRIDSSVLSRYPEFVSFKGRPVRSRSADRPGGVSGLARLPRKSDGSRLRRIPTRPRSGR